MRKRERWAALALLLTCVVGRSGLAQAAGAAQGTASGGATSASGAAASSASTAARAVVVVDAAHGGQDAGATLKGNVLEKDVTLALALRLRSLLQARDFSVVLTRDADSADPVNGSALVTDDQRAGMANHAHAIACVLLHATASGHGVHVYTSGLRTVRIEAGAAGLGTAGSGTAGSGTAKGVAWDRAQAGSLEQSERLAAELGAALRRASLPVVVAQASARPIDSLMCPAVAIEMAPLGNGDETQGSVSDAGYQQRVAEAVAGVLLFWRGELEQLKKAAAESAAANAQAAAAASAAKTAAKAAASRPVPAGTTDEVPR